MASWRGASSSFWRLTQRRLLQRIARILTPRGRLLFASPVEPVAWNDATTGAESRSLGAQEYRRHLESVGFRLVAEYEDEGQNHYFDARKTELAQRQ